MMKLLKLYIAVFCYIGNRSDDFVFDHCAYKIIKGQKKWLILLSAIFISIPGFIAIVCSRIDQYYDLSLPAILLLYGFIYLVTALLAGCLAKHLIFTRILENGQRQNGRSSQ